MNANTNNTVSDLNRMARTVFDPVLADTGRHYAELDQSAAQEAMEESIKERLAMKFKLNLFDASGWLNDAEQRLCAIQQAAFDRDEHLCAILVREMFNDYKEAWLEKETAEIMKHGTKQDAFNYGLF